MEKVRLDAVAADHVDRDAGGDVEISLLEEIPKRLQHNLRLLPEPLGGSLEGAARGAAVARCPLDRCQLEQYMRVGRILLHGALTVEHGRREIPKPAVGGRNGNEDAW